MNCVFGKQTRVSFSKGQCTTTYALDYTMRAWTFTIRTHNEAFDIFKQWKALVENQKGSKVKMLRIDNGLEFVNEIFDNSCKD